MCHTKDIMECISRIESEHGVFSSSNGHLGTRIRGTLFSDKPIFTKSWGLRQTLAQNGLASEKPWHVSGVSAI